MGVRYLANINFLTARANRAVPDVKDGTVALAALANPRIPVSQEFAVIVHGAVTVGAVALAALAMQTTLASLGIAITQVRRHSSEGGLTEDKRYEKERKTQEIGKIKCVAAFGEMHSHLPWQRQDVQE